MRAFTLFALLTSFLLVSNERAVAEPLEWPPVVMISWNGYTDVHCFKGLIYCLLKATSDSSDFADSVSLRSHSIYWWSSQSWSCIVNINTTQDLATEALYYKNSSMTRYAAPMTLIGQRFWPPDELYADEDIREQWHLTADWAPEGVNDSVHINWSPVVNELQQRGNENVVLGIIDDGIMWDEEEGLLHPDLKSNRFHIGESYDETIDNTTPHGTAVLSMMAADAENTDSLDNNEGDWGMTGVNTESDVWIYKGASFHVFNPPDSVWFLVQAMETEAFKHLVRNHSPHIINYSSGFFPSEVRAEEDTLWELAFLDLLAEGRDMPLLVCAAGNIHQIGEDWVAFPARNAFISNAEGYERGFPFVVSVSGISETGERYFSFDNGHNHISLVAPSGTEDLEILGGWDSRRQHIGGLPEEYEPWFSFWNGTSFAAPLVAGVASLVLSQDWDVNEERTLDAWALRKIIEKTARDVNDTTKPYFDDEMGFGLIDCYVAVTKRDLYYWKLNANTWYYLSSNIDPVYDTIPRIMEEITLDNNDYDNGLKVLKSWSHATQTELIWEPGVQADHIDWNVQRMLKVKLNPDPDKFTDTLWICGQKRAIDDDILLFDTDSTAGWNWTAYYPRYEAKAESALTSIATYGDPASDLYLAKGFDGKFYSVDFSFSNLTMKPGQGYMLQLDEDRNDTLIYPEGDPDQVPRKPKGAEKPISETEHFRFIAGTGDFLPILILDVEIPDREPEPGDEVGVFIADTLCIGGVLWNGDTPLGFAAWRDDETTPDLDGYRNLNSLTFRFWDRSENEEIREIGTRTSSADLQNNGSLWAGNLIFKGPVSRPEIPRQFRLGPVFPNPFNSTAIVHYEVPIDINVSLILHDQNGRQIRDIYTGYNTRGTYRLTIDSSELPSGLYFLRMNTNASVITAKVEVLR